MIKKIFIAFLVSISIFQLFGITNLNAQNTDNKTTIYLFWGDGCPHCEKEKEFLGKIKEKYGNLSIRDYEIWYNQDNAKLLQKVGEKLGENIPGVPFTIIGDKTISGYYNDETTGKQIEDYINYCQENFCENKVDELLECECSEKENTKIKNETNPIEIKENAEKQIKENNSEEKPLINNNNVNKNTTEEKLVEKNNPIQLDENVEKKEPSKEIKTSEIQFNNKNIESLDIPFFGKLELKNFSLPIITIIIGTLDGFNPCAMWILLFLMSMLIGMNDRKKVWILGGAFIFTSAFAYYLFMVAWLKIILFFGFLLWIRLGIGLFAIGGGGFSIFQYFKSKDSGCHVIKEDKRTKIFTKIRDILHKKSFFISLIGICILAFGVNIVELLCSAGLPVVYTQILSLNNLSNIEYYLYILLYIFFFMLDDLIIFAIGMITLKLAGISTKYTKYSHLIGGIIMLSIGILLIFKPEILMF